LDGSLRGTGPAPPARCGLAVTVVGVVIVIVIAGPRSGSVVFVFVLVDHVVVVVHGGLASGG
jgi:hypothetical protein